MLRLFELHLTEQLLVLVPIAIIHSSQWKILPTTAEHPARDDFERQIYDVIPAFDLAHKQSFCLQTANITVSISTNVRLFSADQHCRNSKKKSLSQFMYPSVSKD